MQFSNDLKDIQSKSSTENVAFKETLELLEWPRLCEQISTFASTQKGSCESKNLLIAFDLKTANELLAETIEIGSLDEVIEGGVSFQGVHDLSNILRRCSKGGVCSGEDLLQVANTLSAARRLRRQIFDSDLRPVLTKLVADMKTIPDLEKLLKYGIEDGGRVADRASAVLLGLRRKSQSLRLERRNYLQDILQRYAPYLQDNLISDRFGRPVIALKAGFVNKLPGLVHDSSSSGNTIFLEPQLVIPLGNKIAEFEGYVLEEEQRLLAEWSLLVGNNFSVLDNLCKIILKLDLALTRSRYGNWLSGVPPTLVDKQDAPFVLEKLRHPLLIWKEKYEQGNIVVPVSLEVSSDTKVVAITGPNTGGKTVTLKSVGLATLMARAGLFLPCIGQPCLPWCSQILADIGDEQSLQQSLSTFSGHLMRIARILETVSQEDGLSLVLLDEIGAGTDPTEGTALAIALLKTLADKARLTIATTHFGELKTLKYSDYRFENASVAFDSETITPTYQLQWGIPGKSNALEIAGRLGLDPLVIKKAQHLIGKNNIEVNKVILGLEKQRKRQQDAAEAAAALLARTELLHDELLARWQKQCEQTEEMQKLERQNLTRSISQGQKEVRNLIRRLRAENADGETARKVGQRLRLIENENRPQLLSNRNQGWLPRLGEKIRLIALGKAAEVVDISDSGLQLTVLCGVFRSTVSLAEVESLDGQKPVPPEQVIKVKSTKSFSNGSVLRTNHNTLDVRGLRLHEAEVAAEEHLRKASGPFWIVHGIGTGKLKRGLREWLQTVPYVEKVVDADQKDGGAGCTVVWLK